jgi:hypothetical protein
VAALYQLAAGSMTHEPACSRDQNPHDANDTLARWTCR